jgi:hypothetical protein
MQTKLLRAATDNNLNQLKILHRRGHDWGDESHWILQAIVKNKNFEMLQWALEHGCPWDCGITSAIVEMNSNDKKFVRDMLAWCITFARKNYPNEELWCEDFMYDAITSSNEPALKWAVVNGCPWNPNSAHFIVEMLNMKLLKWALRHGCPLTDVTYVFSCAAEYSIQYTYLEESPFHWDWCMDIFNYCLEKGCAWNVKTVEQILYYTIGDKYRAHFWEDLLYWLAYLDYPVKYFQRDINYAKKERNKDIDTTYYVKLFMAYRFEKKYKHMVAKESADAGRYMDAYFRYKRLRKLGCFDARKKMQDVLLAL